MWIPIELFVTALACTPIVSAAKILHKLDRAAKNQRQPVQIWIVDIMCLMFMLQLPFAAFSYFDRPIVEIWFIPLGLSAVMGLVWWTTVKTVSAGGINEFKWRSSISLFVIPMTYIGSFALAVVCINSLMGNFGAEYSWVVGLVSFVALVIGLLVSNTIVNRAVLAVKIPKTDLIPPQVVNKKCSTCEDSIMFERDGHFCPSCRGIWCVKCQPKMPCESCRNQVTDVEMVG